MPHPVSASSWLVLVAIVVALVLVGVASAPKVAPAISSSGGPALAPSAASPKPTQVEASASTASASPARSTGVDTGGPGTLADLVERLSRAPEQRAGYDRSLFRLWVDADGDGCDTREEVLIAEAIVAPTADAQCSLAGGQWLSIYDGLLVSDVTTLDIDHVVPLTEAWDSGAFAWSSDRREAFANDLGVPWALVAVTAASNRSKSDHDPAEWLPPLSGVRCEYVMGWISVKVRWRLTIDAGEDRVLRELVGTCSHTPAPVILTQ